MRQLAILLGGLPLALWGLATHAVPYWLTLGGREAGPARAGRGGHLQARGGRRHLSARVDRRRAGCVWRWGGGWLLALFAVLLIPGGFFALAWGERLRRLYREGRALLRLLVDRDLGRHLGGRRRAILDEMDRAVARVPEAVLAGREEPRG